MGKVTDANMRAGTTIDRWLRDNPNSTPAEAAQEFLRRFKRELADSQTEMPPEIARALDGHFWELFEG